MQENENTLIVTKTPVIEIDGRYFQTPFEAEKYLVQTRGMRVASARERLRELVHEALNKPEDPSRRLFLESSGGVLMSTLFPPKVMASGLLRHLDDNKWAQEFWGVLNEEQKQTARFHFVQDLFLPRGLTGSTFNCGDSDKVGTRSVLACHPLFFLFSSHCNRTRLDQGILLSLVAKRADYIRGEAANDAWLKEIGAKDVEPYFDQFARNNLHEESIGQFLTYSSLSRGQLLQKGTKSTPHLNSLQQFHLKRLGDSDIDGTPRYTLLTDHLSTSSDRHPIHTLLSHLYQKIGGESPRLGDTGTLVQGMRYLGQKLDAHMASHKGIDHGMSPSDKSALKEKLEREIRKNQERIILLHESQWELGGNGHAHLNGLIEECTDTILLLQDQLRALEESEKDLTTLKQETNMKNLYEVSKVREVLHALTSLMDIFPL